VNAIALRSGKPLVNLSPPIQKEDEKVKTVYETLDVPELEEKIVDVAEPVVEPKIAQQPGLVSKHIPFPSRLEDKQRKDEEEFISFLNLFKSLNINFPLLELIEKIPKYVKYLKEIISRHTKLKKGEKINIDASCTAISPKNYP